jgi:hypothetical protein
LIFGRRPRARYSRKRNFRKSHYHIIIPHVSSDSDCSSTPRPPSSPRSVQGREASEPGNSGGFFGAAYGTNERDMHQSVRLSVYLTILPSYRLAGEADRKLGTQLTEGKAFAIAIKQGGGVSKNWGRPPSLPFPESPQRMQGDKWDGIRLSGIAGILNSFWNHF